MKSGYRVSMYFNPLLNNEGSSMVSRSVIKYDSSRVFYNNENNRFIWNSGEYGVCSCDFDAAEFVFDCKNSQLPLIEDKKSCVPPLVKLGSKAEVIKRWRLRHEI